MDNTSTSNVVVAVRNRPLNQREIREHARNIVCMSEHKLILENMNEITAPKQPQHEFNFNYCYDSSDPSSPAFVDQEHVFNDIGVPVIERAMEGFNSTIFAYGQTGSGKTYTMTGDLYFEKGLIPRIVEGLFEGVDHNATYSTVITVSYIEIYNEKLRDLLVPDKRLNDAAMNQKSHTLRIRENKNGVYVAGVTKVQTKNYEECIACLNKGNRRREVAETQMNSVSSRSHAVFVMNVRVTRKTPDGKFRHTESVVNLIDLAGSEKQKETKVEGKHLKEACAINKSLFMLGLVIKKLAQKTMDPKKYKNEYIPYRNSVLTKLLSTSLGGNAFTAMIATISPASTNYEVTHSTLRFALNASTIVNVVHRNESEADKVIRELRERVSQLEANLKAYDNIEQDLKSAHKTKEELQREMENLQKKRLQDLIDLDKFKQTIKDLLTSRENLIKKINMWEVERKKVQSGAIDFSIILNLALGPHWRRRPLLMRCNGGVFENNFLNYIKLPEVDASTADGDYLSTTSFGSDSQSDVQIMNLENLAVPGHFFKIYIVKRVTESHREPNINIELSESTTSESSKFEEEISLSDGMNTSDMIFEPSFSPETEPVSPVSPQDQPAADTNPEFDTFGTSEESDSLLGIVLDESDGLEDSISFGFDENVSVDVLLEPCCADEDCVLLINGKVPEGRVTLCNGDRVILLNKKTTKLPGSQYWFCFVYGEGMTVSEEEFANDVNCFVSSQMDCQVVVAQEVPQNDQPNAPEQPGEEEAVPTSSHSKDDPPAIPEKPVTVIEQKEQLPEKKKQCSCSVM